MTREQEKEVRKIVGGDWLKVALIILVQSFSFGYWAATMDGKLYTLTQITAEKSVLQSFQVNSVRDMVIALEKRFVILESRINNK